MSETLDEYQMTKPCHESLFFFLKWDDFLIELSWERKTVRMHSEVPNDIFVELHYN